MAPFEIVTLVLGVTVVAAFATGVEWLPRYMKRRTVNWRVGVSQEPELRDELLKAFLTIWLCRSIQLGLVGVVILARPSGIAWVPIVLVFLLSLMLSFSADKTRRSLLAYCKRSAISFQRSA